MSGNQRAPEFDRESIMATPRWVKLFGIVAIIVALLFVILHVTGGSVGGHRLMQHGV
jgi:hypothetical protein